MKVRIALPQNTVFDIPFIDYEASSFYVEHGTLVINKTGEEFRADEPLIIYSAGTWLYAFQVDAVEAQRKDLTK